jgi:hypothetical protein
MFKVLDRIRAKIREREEAAVSELTALHEARGQKEADLKTCE